MVPLQDPSWQYTFAPVAPSLAGYPFAIELGNVTRLEDGLIGYFSGDDYTRFNVTEPRAAQPVPAADRCEEQLRVSAVRPQAAEYVSMLVDPGASVHARTGILPTLKLALAPQDDGRPGRDERHVSRGRDPDRLAAVASPAPAHPAAARPAREARHLDMGGTRRGEWTTYATSPNDAAARSLHCPAGPAPRAAATVGRGRPSSRECQASSAQPAESPPPPPPPPPSRK